MSHCLSVCVLGLSFDARTRKGCLYLSPAPLCSGSLALLIVESSRSQALALAARAASLLSTLGDAGTARDATDPLGAVRLSVTLRRLAERDAAQQTLLPWT